MGRSSTSCSSSASYNCDESKRLRSKDHHHQSYHRRHRTRREKRRDHRDERRQAWLRQQEREKEHERLKKRMILEYELKREQIKRYSGEHSRKSSRRSRSSQSRSQHHRRSDPKPTAMAQIFESSDLSTPLFEGGSGIAGATVANSQLQRESVNPGEIMLHWRQDLLDPYFPKWSINNSRQFRLETMLNLQTRSTPDYSKLNNTSTVFCFVPPLVSEMSDISSSQHVERAELVTTKRQHTCTTNSLVYNDSTTGGGTANSHITEWSGVRL
ncbi:uncharacterized protein LOC117180380 isoform X2 [Belonocnema kinseyi]|uniref:uncharacterized protein LOC117180380 isoform X2 n=1 Tax=Belonocnema kinseyi TaxID=2817044 RepID=UPI00143D684E|nr:uncharacterized protein LOC117180380 isoform X2 [Belonocnema kinseyi]